ncbi:hypothetical protein SEA_PETTERN_86 [Mycobacterium phage PetterN]|uniref:Uncharacterized protein n=4 Tax=Benedictvirus TaxID=2946819 RepID=A0A2P1N2H2_9CAUD|nr:hypothetical protein AVV06_gp12 [Mycobacterium phage Chadwick]YP_009637984.1 hypothetical protein FGG33_gp16 [Mycobacterium phage Benedict]YP_010060705.1 hypothetical protein KIP48_gp12 [Mycobacterium phage Naca]YP_010060791.1 hypothetical protein KIP49_gp12 [Mycobacterium phage Scorpia]QGJ97130.1 hypothetical protein SEA_PETTERN_86 [Mycobacterium phage PetterN]AEJ93436.1 hypothetical protein BENEDICT_81 [Mycobacterium phage Benedict]ALA06810.1 hypothetical protein SEA_CHADWICK_83 [Mycobac
MKNYSVWAEDWRGHRILVVDDILSLPRAEEIAAIIRAISARGCAWVELS